MYCKSEYINLHVLNFPEMPSNEEISKVIGRSARFRPLHVAAKDSTSARRALFGPADHQENARVLAELSDQLNQQAKIRWNFDFLNCEPQPGRYEWSCRPTEAMDDRTTDDVNDRVNDVTSGVDMVESSSVDLNDIETAVCDEISPSFTAPSSSSKYEQTISNLMKRQTNKIIRRLTWAPKKKIRFLSRASRRAQLQRSATIPDYYPVRKRLEF